MRIHANATAADSARALHARAFTAGTDIFFSSGRFAPNTAAGHALLAHELHHVIEREAPGPAANVEGDTDLAAAADPVVQLAPDEAPLAPSSVLEPAAMPDPLLDYEEMMTVAREGARQLDEYLNNYTLGMSCSRSAMTLSAALASGKTPEFSADYEATVATIRDQALTALQQAKGYFENLDAKSISAWGGAAIESTNVAIAAIEDGDDIVFIVDSRSAEGGAVLTRIDHFREQLAIRDRGFQGEEGRANRLSAGLSAHEGQIDPALLATAPRAQHRSVSILDTGALFDNRALNNFVGPVQDPPGMLRIEIETAAAVDIRALFIHEVGGHAISSETPAEKERRQHGDPVTPRQKEAHRDLEEALVDNMVNKVAFFSLIRDDLPRSLVQRLGSE